MAYTVKQKALFRHRDLTGMAFYPRYFERVHDCVEDFFVRIGHDCQDILKYAGMLTVHIDTLCTAAGRHGDTLKLIFACKALGNSSLKLELNAFADDQKRFSTKATLVHLDVAIRKPALWANTMRAALKNLLENA